MMDLPPTPVTALTLITLECTEFVEPYIPEDQERDEATGQPKKKARLNGADDSANGGSPASQHAVVPTTTTPVPPVHNGRGYQLPVQESNRPQASHHPSVLDRPTPDSNRVNPYMPRPAPSYMSSSRLFASPFSPSPWSPVGSGFHKSPITTLPQVSKPHPYSPTAQTLPQSHSNGNTPTLASRPAPNSVSSPSSASASAPTAVSGLGPPGPPNSSPAPGPVTAQEVQLAMQASLDRQAEEEKEKEKRLEIEEKERKWEEMRAKAASIVETVRKEGINGGFM